MAAGSGVSLGNLFVNSAVACGIISRKNACRKSDINRKFAAGFDNGIVEFCN
jgi:hypothetical protein